MTKIGKLIDISPREVWKHEAVVRIGNSIPAPVFDVLARPNQWERSMQKKVREKTGDSSSFAAIRKAFWKHYLQRYPDDADSGVQITGNPSNWLAPPKEIGMFVAIYKAKTGVGVFLRGQRGVMSSEIQAKIAPYAAEFKKFVGTCKYIAYIPHLIGTIAIYFIFI